MLILENAGLEDAAALGRDADPFAKHQSTHQPFATPQSTPVPINPSHPQPPQLHPLPISHHRALSPPKLPPAPHYQHCSRHHWQRSALRSRRAAHQPGRVKAHSPPRRSAVSLPCPGSSPALHRSRSRVRSSDPCSLVHRGGTAGTEHV